MYDIACLTLNNSSSTLRNHWNYCNRNTPKKRRKPKKQTRNCKRLSPTCRIDSVVRFQIWCGPVGHWQSKSAVSKFHSAGKHRQDAVSNTASIQQCRNKDRRRLWLRRLLRSGMFRENPEWVWTFVLCAVRQRLRKLPDRCGSIWIELKHLLRTVICISPFAKRKSRYGKIW